MNLFSLQSDTKCWRFWLWKRCKITKKSQNVRSIKTEISDNLKKNFGKKKVIFTYRGLLTLRVIILWRDFKSWPNFKLPDTIHEHPKILSSVQKEFIFQPPMAPEVNLTSLEQKKRITWLLLTAQWKNLRLLRWPRAKGPRPKLSKSPPAAMRAGFNSAAIVLNSTPRRDTNHLPNENAGITELLFWTRDFNMAKA